MSDHVTYFNQDFLQTSDGASLFFQVQGEGEIPAVMCDGLGCDGFAWKYLLPVVRTQRKVVRWHYRGHGRSGVPEDDRRIGMEFTCDDLLAVMDRTKVEKAVLFGHSMGVQVALEFHRRYKDRVAGLVLLCGSFGHPLDTWHGHSMLGKVFPFLLGAVERFPNVARAMTGNLTRNRVAVEFGLRTELNKDLMQREDFFPYLEHLSRMDPLMFVRTLDSLKDHSAWDHLPFIDVPTIVVGGEIDRFTPVHLSRRMADAIPGAQYLEVPGGSHTALLERPGMVNNAVAKYLREKIDAPFRAAKKKSA